MYAGATRRLPVRHDETTYPRSVVARCLLQLVACRPVLLCAAAAAAYRPESGHAGARMEAMGGVEANAYSLV